MQTDPQLSAVVNRIMEVRAEAMKLRPVNRALYTPKPESELSKDESWKGESKLRSVKRFNYSGRNMKTDKVHQRIANLTQRRAKVGPLFANGIKPTDIACQLGCSEHTINNDLKALGLK